MVLMRVHGEFSLGFNCKYWWSNLLKCKVQYAIIRKVIIHESPLTV